MKKCNVCGADMPDESVVCPACGTRLGNTVRQGAEQNAYSGIPVAGNGQVPQYAAQAPQKPMNGVGLAGMIVGILSYIFCWVPVLDFILGLVGVILSGVGMSRKANYRLNGFAVAGLVLSIIGLFIGLIYMIVFFVALSVAA